MDSVLVDVRRARWDAILRSALGLFTPTAEFGPCLVKDSRYLAFLNR